MCVSLAEMRYDNYTNRNIAVHLTGHKQNTHLLQTQVSDNQQTCQLHMSRVAHRPVTWQRVALVSAVESAPIFWSSYVLTAL